MEFTFGDNVNIITENSPRYYNDAGEQDPFDGDSELEYGMTVRVNDICSGHFLDVEVEWLDEADETRFQWVNNSILRKEYGPSRKSSCNAVLNKILELEAKFNERKKNASNIPLQNGKSGSKKPLPFPKAAVTFSETSPF